MGEDTKIFFILIAIGMDVYILIELHVFNNQRLNTT